MVRECTGGDIYKIKEFAVYIHKYINTCIHASHIPYIYINKNIITYIDRGVSYVSGFLPAIQHSKPLTVSTGTFVSLYGNP